jgi:hypothetical protein
MRRVLDLQNDRICGDEVLQIVPILEIRPKTGFSPVSMQKYDHHSILNTVLTRLVHPRFLLHCTRAWGCDSVFVFLIQDVVQNRAVDEKYCRVITESQLILEDSVISFLSY